MADVSVNISSPTASLVEQWLHGRPATTRRRYRAVVVGLLSECSDSSDISPADVTGYLNRRAELAPSTRNTALAAIKSFLRYAHESGAIARDVGRLVKTERVRDDLTGRILTQEQVKRMIEGATGRERLIVQTLYVAGLRVAELCGLRLDDVRDGVLTIYGKGGKTRYVRVSEDLIDTLTSAAMSTNGRIFGVSPRTVERIVKDAAIRAGLPAGVSPHWLRHCHATHALENGAPIHLVQATLGHSDVKTTSRYLHARPEDSSARYLGL